MFIVRNALHNVVRNKGRNALMIIIVAIITAAATVALAIVQAAERARTSALDDTTISAQISIDRGAMIGKTRDAQSGGADMQAMRESMASKQLDLDDYQKYDKSEYGVASSYYTETASAAAVDDGVEPVDSNGTVTNQEDQSATEQNQSGEQPQSPGDDRAGGMPDAGGGKGGMMMTTGDFSLVGFSSDEAIANAPNGSFTMDSGQVFDYGTDDDGDVIISKTLADANDLSVGDTFKVADITDDTKTYTLTIVGIYSNTTENTMPMGGPMASTASDPANAIYTSVSTLDALGLTGGKTIEITDARGNTRETQATQLSYTYVFNGKAQYDRFVADVKANGLGNEYTVSSADVEQYEASLVPLNNLATFAKTAAHRRAVRWRGRARRAHHLQHPRTQIRDRRAHRDRREESEGGRAVRHRTARRDRHRPGAWRRRRRRRLGPRIELAARVAGRGAGHAAATAACAVRP